MAGLAWLSLSPSPGQTIISARAGLIHYAEGQVWLESQEIETEFTELTKFYRAHIQEHQHLRTSAGRAEVVLAPGSILRMGEKSQVQMLSSRIQRGEAQAD